MRKLIWGFSTVTIVTFGVGMAFEIDALTIAGFLLFFLGTILYSFYRMTIKKVRLITKHNC